MGLASSQARMLLLTARKSDLEYRSQMISQRKINLAMQTEALAKTYSSALNDKVMKFTYTTAKGESQQEVLGYDSFMSSSNDGFIGDYLVKAANGKYVASNVNDMLKIAAKLANAEGRFTDTKTVTRNYYSSESANADKQEFKYSNLRNENYLVRISDEKDPNNTKFLASSAEDQLKIANILAANEGKTLTDENKEEFLGRVVVDDKHLLTKESDALGQACRSGAVSIVKFNKPEKEGEEGEYITAINKDDIKMEVKAEDVSRKYNVANVANLPQKDAEDLLNAYGNQITIVEGLKNNAFFQDALRNGALFLYKKESEDQTEYESLSWSADRNISDVADTSNDAQAQADYEAKSLVLSNQDKMLDLELNQIETQHKAIETEYDSVKKVIQKNIEVSYKIFA